MWFLLLIPLVGALFGAAVAAFWPEGKGKKILVLGPSLAGKTTLSTFLIHGVIPLSYIKTAGTKAMEGGEIKFKDLRLKLDVIWDAPGDEGARRAWLEKAKQADLILYMLSYAEANQVKYAKRVRLDCNQIRAWRNNAGDDVTANVMVVVSHLDHHRDFKYGVSHDRADEAGQLARETSACKSALRELPESPVIAGSLREEQGCADVAYRLLVEVQKGG